MQWSKLFVKVAMLATVALIAIDLVKGRPLETAATNGLVWGLIVAAIVMASRAYRGRRNRACALCTDAPAETGPSVEP